MPTSQDDLRLLASELRSRVHPEPLGHRAEARWSLDATATEEEYHRPLLILAEALLSLDKKVDELRQHLVVYTRLDR